MDPIYENWITLLMFFVCEWTFNKHLQPVLVLPYHNKITFRGNLKCAVLGVSPLWHHWLPPTIVVKQHYNGPKWKGNIWRNWTFDMYLILQKWLNSIKFPPLGSVPFFLSRSLFFFSTIIFYCHSQDCGCLAISFLVRNEWVGAAADCTARSKEEQTRHGGTARTGCQSFAAATSSVDVIPQPGVTHIIRLIYITPPRGTNIISHRAKAKTVRRGRRKKGARERAETKVWTARGLF